MARRMQLQLKNMERTVAAKDDVVDRIKKQAQVSQEVLELNLKQQAQVSLSWCFGWPQGAGASIPNGASLGNQLSLRQRREHLRMTRPCAFPSAFVPR